MESMEDFGLKIGVHNHGNENMKNCEFKEVKVILWPLGHVFIFWQFQTFKKPL